MCQETKWKILLLMPWEEVSLLISQHWLHNQTIDATTAAAFQQGAGHFCNELPIRSCRSSLQACWNTASSARTVPYFQKCNLSFLLKKTIKKITLTEKNSFINRKMLHMFLLLEVTCTFVLWQLFSLNTDN